MADKSNIIGGDIECSCLGKHIDQTENECMGHCVEFSAVLMVDLVQEPIFVSDNLGQKQLSNVDGAAG